MQVLRFEIVVHELICSPEWIDIGPVGAGTGKLYHGISSIRGNIDPFFPKNTQ